MSPQPQRIIVALSGSSGPHYGVRVLELLRAHTDIEVHLILTSAARTTIAYEMGRDPAEIEQLAHVSHADHDTAASVASGSFLTMGMIVAPCSIKSLSAIANSYNDTLIARAADVCLKERRKVVLLVRETPLHLGHLRLMRIVTEAGAVIFPPTPSFYHLPTSMRDIIDHTVMRALDQFGIHLDLFPRWAGVPFDRPADANEEAAESGKT